MAIASTVFHIIAMCTAGLHIGVNGITLPAVMWLVWAFISWLGWLEALRRGK